MRHLYYARRFDGAASGTNVLQRWSRIQGEKFGALCLSNKFLYPHNTPLEGICSRRKICSKTRRKDISRNVIPTAVFVRYICTFSGCGYCALWNRGQCVFASWLREMRSRAQVTGETYIATFGKRDLSQDACFAKNVRARAHTHARTQDLYSTAQVKCIYPKDR